MRFLSELTSFLSGSISSVAGATHFGLAIASLIVGVFIFAAPKGTTTHRITGTLWATAMLIVNVTALTIYDIRGGITLFHIFAVVNLAALIPGYVYVRLYQMTRDPNHLRSHKLLMVWAYFGLAAAGVWQTGLPVLADLMAGGYPDALRFLFVATIAASIATSLILRLVVAPPTANDASARD